MRMLIEETTGFVVAGLVLLGTAMIDVSDPIIMAAGTTILGILTGAVKVLWDRNNKLSAATDVALQQCKEEHQKAASNMDTLIKQVITLSGEVGVLTGRIQGFQEATEKATAASNARNKEAHQTI